MRLYSLFVSRIPRDTTKIGVKSKVHSYVRNLWQEDWNKQSWLCYKKPAGLVELVSIFSECGEVMEVDICAKPQRYYTYAFVRFSDPRIVLKAVQDVGSWMLRDKLLKVDISHKTRRMINNMPASCFPSITAVMRDVNDRSRLQDACHTLNKEVDVVRGNPQIDVVELLSRMERRMCGNYSVVRGTIPADDRTTERCVFDSMGAFSKKKPSLIEHRQERLRGKITDLQNDLTKNKEGVGVTVQDDLQNDLTKNKEGVGVTVQDDLQNDLTQNEEGVGVTVQDDLQNDLTQNEEGVGVTVQDDLQNDLTQNKEGVGVTVQDDLQNDLTQNEEGVGVTVQDDLQNDLTQNKEGVGVTVQDDLQNDLTQNKEGVGVTVQDKGSVKGQKGSGTNLEKKEKISPSDGLKVSGLMAVSDFKVVSDTEKDENNTTDIAVENRNSKCSLSHIVSIELFPLSTAKRESLHTSAPAQFTVSMAAPVQFPDSTKVLIHEGTGISSCYPMDHKTQSPAQCRGSGASFSASLEHCGGHVPAGCNDPADFTADGNTEEGEHSWYSYGKTYTSNSKVPTYSSSKETSLDGDISRACSSLEETLLDDSETRACNSPEGKLSDSGISVGSPTQKSNFSKSEDQFQNLEGSRLPSKNVMFADMESSGHQNDTFQESYTKASLDGAVTSFHQVVKAGRGRGHFLTSLAASQLSTDRKVGAALPVGGRGQAFLSVLKMKK